MSSIYTVSLDAMGGDFGPSVTVPAACRALAEFTDLRLILVGDQDAIRQEMAHSGCAENERLSIHHASQVVKMDDPPAVALRTKRDSSMRVAINLVKAGESDAAVSAGNTGALMANSRFVLKTLPGIDRPAIMTALPSAGGGRTHMLDLGANVDCKAEHLFQFAAMGSVAASAVDGTENPRVGLLNVGQEAIKGNLQVKLANGLLEGSRLNYIGYVEGDDIYTDKVDVVVCDGFVGNVSLKSSEGVARMITNVLKQGFRKNLFTRLAGALAVPVMKSVFENLDPRRYNGASLLGLKGIVVKSHGGADDFSFSNAIRIARLEAQEGVPVRISKQLGQLLDNAQDG